MSEQLELFSGTAASREFLAWLQSPPGTMAPWVVRERQAKKPRVRLLGERI